MGTAADKLAYLTGTKDAIKQAIAAKGVDIPDGTTFRGYAEKINNISGMLSSYYKSVVIYSNPANWFINRGVDCVVAIIISTGGGTSASISAIEALLAYKGGQMTGDNYTLTLSTDGTMATVQLTGQTGSGRQVVFSGFNY